MALGAFPSWVDYDFVRNASAGLIVAGAVVAVICMIMIRSLAARLIVLVLLAAGGIGLYHYRDTLTNCAKNCECRLFGENIPGGHCRAAGTDTAPVAREA